ncbi:MAG: hypothetical protein Q7S35_13030 [Candidatus Limnocylindrales bacterium]|nr:hypothetical protein [Candidatus Limnocylindrales bacterium]
MTNQGRSALDGRSDATVTRRLVQLTIDRLAAVVTEPLDPEITRCSDDETDLLTTSR